MKILNNSVQNFKFKNRISFKRFLPKISLHSVFIYIIFIIGCSYYRVNTLNPLSNETIAEQAKKKDKYIIIHQGNNVWHLRHVVVNETGQEIKGTVQTLPNNHRYYETAKGDYKPNRYDATGRHSDRPVHEIHIYTSIDSYSSDSTLTIPFSSISKVEVYDPDVGTTVLSALGVGAAFGIIVGLIAVATKSSCPFVYANNGDSYTFVGEMYGGAIYASLERDDYMPLPNLTPINSQYQLRISNELLERQYTNVANLVVVEHANTSQVILDKAGDIQTITSPESPRMAITNADTDATELIMKKDSNSYLFDEESPDGKDLSSLTLSFKKPENSKTGKLILNAKNSFWLDYAYGKFNEQFGIYYNTFVKKQRKIPAQKHNQWSLEQNIPLSIYIETEKGWKFVDYFNSIGPLASRDIIMSIDLSEINGENVKIKMECGFMFWEIDYAAMDFSENISVEINYIKSSSAIDEKGKDVAKLIEKSDKQYLIQPEIGNVVTLEYPALTPKANQRQTVFLYSRGYYEYIRDYKNWPDVVKLQSFKEKGSFTRFSKTKFNESITKDILAASLTQTNGN